MIVARIGLGILIIVAGAASAGAARAQDDRCAATFKATTLNLSAEGEVKLAPDRATLTLGVTADAPTAASAVHQERGAMAATMGVLKAQGIAARDIETSGLDLSPQYVYAPQTPPRSTGYQAVNTLTVTVRDLSHLGAVVDAAVAAGANRIQGISFGLDHPETAKNEARREAAAALRAKADLYASATGYRIARLVSLSEGAAGEPRFSRMMAAAPAIAALPAPGSVATPVAPGELTVAVTVQGVYELTK